MLAIKGPYSTAAALVSMVSMPGAQLSDDSRAPILMDRNDGSPNSPDFNLTRAGSLLEREV